MLGDLIYCSGVDERAVGHASLESGAHLEVALHPLLELGGEFTIDAALDIDPIRAHTGLSVAPEFGGYTTRHGGIDVLGVVEDNEGGIPAELER